MGIPYCIAHAKVISVEKTTVKVLLVGRIATPKKRENGLQRREITVEKRHTKLGRIATAEEK